MRKMRLLVLGIAVTVAAGCGGGAPAPPFHPVADTQLLMSSLVEPNANLLWDSVGTSVDESGVHEIGPGTQEEWTALRNGAIALAETGNLLMMAPRAMDDKDWMEGSRALVDAGALAIRAVEARDASELFEVGATLYDVCTSCHRRYVPEGFTQP